MYPNFFITYSDFFYDHCVSRKKHDMQIVQYHDSYELLYLKDGERFLFMDGVCYPLKGGYLYFIKPFDLHYSQSLESNFYERYVINFTKQQFSDILTSSEIKALFSSLPSGIYQLTEENQQFCTALFQSFEYYYQKTGILASKAVLSICFQILLLLKNTARITPFQNQKTEDSSPGDMARVIDYINNHYWEELTLDSLASYAHLSKYHFCRKFKEVTGVTFLDYLNGIRLAKAHRMLLKTNLSLQEIARRTGFHSSTHFSRIFRNYYQVAPSKFRKENIES